MSDVNKTVLGSRKTTHHKGDKDFPLGRVEEKGFSEKGEGVVTVKDLSGKPLAGE